VSALLADQYFLIAHEERTGRSRLHPRATGLGLAACLVGELILQSRLRITNGELAVVSLRPPGDLLSHNVLDLVAQQPQHRDLRVWLAVLAQDAAGRVGERMLRSGMVEPVTRRRLTGSHTVYMPVRQNQRNAAAWASARLANLLVAGRPMDLNDRLLAGLVAATGLTRYVLWNASVHRQGFTNLYSIVDSLPPESRELVEHTEASVGSALAAGRR
jgi:hypothetical protein